MTTHAAILLVLAAVAHSAASAHDRIVWEMEPTSGLSGFIELDPNHPDYAPGKLAQLRGGVVTDFEFRYAPLGAEWNPADIPGQPVFDILIFGSTTGPIDAEMLIMIGDIQGAASGASLDLFTKFDDLLGFELGTVEAYIRGAQIGPFRFNVVPEPTSLMLAAVLGGWATPRRRC